ncbi:MAG TPA: sulfotransferase [Ardenticatenaceae bacterium]|nr:sulfotransferase [Ardenticatenaceae bacterium]
MTIQIIGAGLGRTGTLSLKVALERLGFDPCYHMIEVFKHPAHVRVWKAAAEGQAVDWPALFGDYQATVDFPGCSFYKELMAAYPEAKVLLSVRDPERWYESTNETIYQMPRVIPGWLHRLPWVRNLYELTVQVVWQGQFEGRFEDRAHTIALFNAWNAEVQRTVPREKLLVFDVRQGWEPLCAFLGVPVPAEPFPHVNEREEMLQRFRTLRAIQRWTPIVVGVIVALLALVWITRPTASRVRRRDAAPSRRS